MPHYYFHLRTERQFIWDEEGVELSDPMMAQGAADKSAAELRGGLLHTTNHECTWSIAVTHEGGELIHIVSL